MKKHTDKKNKKNLNKNPNEHLINFNPSRPVQALIYLFNKLPKKDKNAYNAKKVVENFCNSPKENRDKPADVIFFLDNDLLKFNGNEYSSIIYKCPKCDDYIINKSAKCCDQCCQLFTHKHLDKNYVLKIIHGRLNKDNKGKK